MSNEIAEYTIKSLYVIEVKNGCLNFILGLQFLARRDNYVASVLCSFKDWVTTNLLTNKFKQFASLH